VASLPLTGDQASDWMVFLLSQLSDRLKIVLIKPRK
jgi:hypothetical protein